MGYKLTACEWAAISPMLPNKTRGRLLGASSKLGSDLRLLGTLLMMGITFLDLYISSFLRAEHNRGRKRRIFTVGSHDRRRKTE